MTAFKYVTTALLLFIITIVALAVRDTDNTETLVGFGITIAIEIMAIICIWG